MEVIELVGWVGNAAYFTRFFLQWVATERAGRPVTPRSFWWLSLGGAVLLLAYSMNRDAEVMLAGYAITSAIYVRNLWISHTHGKGARLGPVRAALVGLAAAALLILIEAQHVQEQNGESLALTLFGAVSMAVWTSRFVLQWWFAEQRGAAEFHTSFWWVSLAGNLLLLVYACLLGDAVFIGSLMPGPVVQVRNLVVARRARNLAQPGGSSRPS
jgi:lipid-A-disaccharide synthase-like uncharacterized protein